MLGHALELLEMGMSVIPISKKTKNPPAGCTWKEQQDTLPDEGLVTDRFNANSDANIGVITGKGSKLIVVDADSEKACLWASEALPITWLQVSNRGRGRHYYFRYPKDKGEQKIKTCSNILYDGIDIRADGGLVVVPPSIHKSGNQYQWEIDSGFSLSDYLDDLPLFPIDKFPQLSGIPHQKQQRNQHYNKSNLKYIADQCPWMRHCREDATILGYDEWVKMISIVVRCEGGTEKAHLLSKPHPEYSYNKTENKIQEATANMGPATCRAICQGFAGCFTCDNLINHGENFSPIQLGEHPPIKQDESLVVMESKEINGKSLNLDIPDNILNTPGLIQEGLELLHEKGFPDIPQLTFPSIVTILANIISTKICYGKTYCNLFTLKIAKTSIGKSLTDDLLISEINQAAKIDTNLKNCSAFTSEFASGAALYRKLERQPHLLCCIDEGTELFRKYKVKHPAQEEKKNALLTLYTKSGQPYSKSYAENKKDIELDDSCLSILTNATPVIFDELQTDDFETGLFQRIDMWCFDGDEPYWGQEKPASNNFVSRLQALSACHQGSSQAISDVLCVPVSLTGSQGFMDLKNKYSRETTDIKKNYQNDGKAGMMARRFNLAIKYALIHVASTRALKDLYEPIETEDLEWGISVANMLVNWKVDKLFSRVTSGTFDSDCEYFKRAVVKVIQKNKKAPTFKYMSDRSRKLKNWSKKYSAEIIEMLVTRKEIVVVDEPGKPTKYYLASLNE